MKGKDKDVRVGLRELLSDFEIAICKTSLLMEDSLYDRSHEAQYGFYFSGLLYHESSQRTRTHVGNILA